MESVLHQCCFNHLVHFFLTFIPNKSCIWNTVWLKSGKYFKKSSSLGGGFNFAEMVCATLPYACCWFLC